VIEQGCAADRGSLLELLAAQLAEHEIEISMERLAAAVDGALAGGDRGRFLIARAEGQAIGVAYLGIVWTLEHGGKSAWLEELYVRPDRRGQGTGTRLLHAALALARAEGCAAVDLEVTESHTRAARLYAREGFRAHTRARWVKVL
jgi:GNAT superfamily N-acetyltransferase